MRDWDKIEQRAFLTCKLCLTYRVRMSNIKESDVFAREKWKSINRLKWIALNVGSQRRLHYE